MFSNEDPLENTEETEEEESSHQALMEGEEELSYAEILASAILNGEVIITIPLEEEERVKTGIKNYKSKQATKQKEEGQPVDSYKLIFTPTISKDYPGCIDFSIQSKTSGTVKIKRMIIPNGEIPE